MHNPVLSPPPQGLSSRQPQARIPKSIEVNPAATTPARKVVRQTPDPVDAMLRGRYSQGSFVRWVWKRIRDLYPK